MKGSNEKQRTRIESNKCCDKKEKKNCSYANSESDQRDRSMVSERAALGYHGADLRAQGKGNYEQSVRTLVGNSYANFQTPFFRKRMEFNRRILFLLDVFLRPVG